jgi:4-amino-4-deoxy-L-arabinose transferase-like glycosyltransferase
MLREMRLRVTRQEFMMHLSRISILTKRIINSKYGLILILITLSIVIGFFISDDFGLSWDEYQDMSYGDAILRAYQGSDDYIWIGYNREYYGPAYWLFASLTSKLLNLLRIQIDIVHLWKYLCFLVFLMAVFFFYILCTRFMKRSIALLATILFGSQPLLFGHAFINQKDIPFMSFFLASVVLGMIAVDHLHERIVFHDKSSGTNEKPWQEMWRNWLTTWMGLRKTKRIFLIALLIALTLLFLELFIFKALILPWMQTTVYNAYDGNAIEPINWLFKRIAQDAYKTPVSMYIEKINSAYNIGRILLLIGLSFTSYLIWRNTFKKDRSKFSFKQWSGEHYILLLAGAILGITISIRVAGPFAGCIVSIYLLTKLGRRSFFPLLLYWSLALVISYSTWPFLWDSPIDRFYESVEVAGSFTHWTTLFRGEIIPSTEMPWYSIPYLMLIEFTEPFVILFAIGSILSLNHIFRRKKEWPLLSLLLMWLGLPLLTVIYFQIPFYDNFRQFLFLVPPIGLVVGVGIASIFDKIKSWPVNAAITLVMLSPGLIGIIRLHPYEYIYYNTFVGSADRVYSQFEADYWCTSFKESADFLNEIAPSNSEIVVMGPLLSVTPFAREDLKFDNFDIFGDALDYVLACRFRLMQDEMYEDFNIIFEVRRGEAVLAQVKAKEELSQ